MDDFFKKNKIGTILTILILITGISAYVYFKPLNQIEDMMQSNLNSEIFNNMQIKIAYTPNGDLKLFANAKNNDLAKLIVIEGNSIPEKETIIIGFVEAQMMKDENLFKNIGDKIENLFGINVTIGGILEKTNTIIDEMHFISEDNYQKLNGEENVVYVKLTGENVSKVFYNYPLSKDSKLNLKLAEGSIENYKTYEIVGKIYYPLIIGFDEAQMMREEKLFEKTGDKIEGFFGKDVIIVGIIEKTNTGLDMIHLIPLSKGDLN